MALTLKTEKPGKGMQLDAAVGISVHLDSAAIQLHDALALAQSAGWSTEFMKRLSAVVNDLADLQGLAS